MGAEAWIGDTEQSRHRVTAPVGATVMATTARHLMTADELLHLPHDGLRRELVRGVLRAMSPTGRLHGRIAVRLTWPLAQFVEAHGLGEV